MVALHSALVCLTLTSVGQTELLDFTATWCGPCRQMEPIVAGMVAQGQPVRKVDIDQNRELAAQYKVTGVPCFVMVVDGREVDRVVGPTSRGRLEQMLRLAARPNSGPAPIAANQAPHAPASPSGIAGGPRTYASEEPPAAFAPRGQSPDVIDLGADEPAAALPREPSAQPLVPEASVAPAAHQDALAAASDALAVGQAAAQRCLASSVRLRIEDASGNSVGSGTIIDTREGEALVLTCGHVFRESSGQGKILVDMFGPSAPKGLAGELVGYDLKRDVGLVSFHTTAPVTVARLAPADYVARMGDPVINVGCDNGREPTALSSRVTGVNKFLGPANIEVAGQPVEGRSGGGLFAADGCLIGVCNAADPTDDQGFYAALPSIYEEIGRLGLTEMLAVGASQAALQCAPPEMARALPETDPSAPPASAVPTSADGMRGDRAGLPAWASDTGALVERLEKGDAEVICIIRPLDDPRKRSEVILLDRASPELLRQLAADRQQQYQSAQRSAPRAAVPTSFETKAAGATPATSPVAQSPGATAPSVPHASGRPAVSPLWTSDAWMRDQGPALRR